MFVSNSFSTKVFKIQASTLILLFFVFTQLIASTLQVPSKTEQEIPKWIKMMDADSVNYFDAITAFDTYWQDKQLPKMEHERFIAKEQNDKQTNELSLQKDIVPYSFEYKKFLHWKERMKPFVKEDGMLMTPKERIVQWEILRRSR